MSKHSITLLFPFEHEGTPYTELLFRRPKGRDLRTQRKSGQTDTDVSFELMATLAEVPVAVIDELDPLDIEQVNDWLEPILDPKGHAQRLANARS